MTLFKTLAAASALAFLVAGCSSVQDQSSSSLPDGPLGSGDGAHAISSCTKFAAVRAETCSAADNPTLGMWHEIFESFGDDAPLENQLFQKELNYLIKHPRHMKSVLENARPYIYHIYLALRAEGLPTEYVAIPMIESMYRPNAISPWKNVGMWQFTASTARNFGLKVDGLGAAGKGGKDERLDPFKSSGAAISYLGYLVRMFDDWELAIAAYNAGEGRVKKLDKSQKKSSRHTNFSNLSMPGATRGYVYKILAFAYYLKNWKKYGVNPPVKDKDQGKISNSVSLEWLDKEQYVDSTGIDPLSHPSWIGYYAVKVDKDSVDCVGIVEPEYAQYHSPRHDQVIYPGVTDFKALELLHVSKGPMCLPEGKPRIDVYRRGSKNSKSVSRDDGSSAEKIADSKQGAKSQPKRADSKQGAKSQPKRGASRQTAKSQTKRGAAKTSARQNAKSQAKRHNGKKSGKFKH